VDERLLIRTRCLLLVVEDAIESLTVGVESKRVHRQLAGIGGPTFVESEAGTHVIFCDRSAVDEVKRLGVRSRVHRLSISDLVDCGQVEDIHLAHEQI
jgi:hypothetical protein